MLAVAVANRGSIWPRDLRLATRQAVLIAVAQAESRSGRIRVSNGFCQLSARIVVCCGPTRRLLARWAACIDIGPADQVVFRIPRESCGANEGAILGLAPLGQT